MDFRVGGFEEALLIVSEFAPFQALCSRERNWEVVHRGDVDPALLRAWKLPPDARAEECLLGNHGAARGRIRMLRITGVPQRWIRPNDQAWDTGGIFDYNVRVSSLPPLYGQLLELGWHGWEEPLEFRLGTSQVREWLGTGPDRIRFAFIERLAPPLPGYGHMRPISELFNSTQVVRDLRRSEHFYRDVMGYDEVVRARDLQQDTGPNVLGLPWNRAHMEGHELVILSPDGGMMGSIELLSWSALEGRDFSADARPPNRGMLGLRFPVRNLDAFAAHAKACGVEQSFGPVPVRLPPLGETRLLGLRSPEGAWLEYFEAEH